MSELRRYKVGIDSETLAISLVDDPAIEEDFVYLKKEKPQQIFMQSEEKHMLYGAVLVPDKDIYRVDDRGNEFLLSFTRESIEKMAYDFIKSYRQDNITLMHEEYANEITLVETWIKSDMEHDKSVALGLNKDLTIGTWFVGMKVNNIEIWEKIKNGELNGFSVESLISIEEFKKMEKENMDADNDTFWTKMKNLLKEVFGTKNEQNEQNTIEPIQMEDMEEQTPTVENQTVDTVVETPTVENQTVAEQPQQEETAAEPQQEETTQETVAEQPLSNPQEEVIQNLLEEIKGLKEQINSLNSLPSSKPVNVQGGNGGARGDAYANWRKQMSKYL